MVFLTLFRYLIGVLISRNEGIILNSGLMKMVIKSGCRLSACKNDP